MGPNRVDIEALLAQISPEQPAGINVKPLGIHDQVAELRRTEDSVGDLGPLRPGEFRTADWQGVISACERELRSRSKDLQIAVWLAEAWTREHELGGLLGGLELVHGLLELFWEHLFPSKGEDGLDIRAGRLEQLDKLLSACLAELNMTDTPDNEAHSLWEWKQIQVMFQAAAAMSKPDQADEKRRIIEDAQARRDNLDAAITKTPRAFYEGLQTGLGECETECEQLRTLTEKSFSAESAYNEMEEQPPRFLTLRNTLQDCRRVVEDILRQKPEEAAESMSPASALVVVSADCQASQAMFSGGSAAPLEDRAEALRCLVAVAAFFQRTEPHSPVSYLIQRAVRWGNMTFDNWLQEVVKDDAVLGHVRETLGIKNSEVQ